MKKRILYLVLAVVLCLGLVEITALTANAAVTYADVVNGRDDGVWLFPLAEKNYDGISDWAGCSNYSKKGSNPCIFDGANHSVYDDPDHKGQLWGEHFLGHNGLDISVVRKEVLASARGIVRVASLGINDGRGNYVVIEHEKDKNNSYYSVYQHLESISARAKEGQTVEAGDVIGISGNSGGEYKYHLHFAILLGEKNYKQTVSTMENAGWFLDKSNNSYWDKSTKSGNKYGRILNNPSVKTYNNSDAIKKLKWSPLVGNPPNSATMHCGSVTYTFDPKEVSIEKSEFFIAKPETGKTAIPVRESSKSSAKQLYTIDKGVPVLIVGSEKNSSGNTWYKTKDGGWIYSERLEPINSNPSFKSYSAKNMFIVKNNAPIRYSSYQESGKVKTLKHMNTISVIAEFTNARDNKWYMDSEGHWIYSGNISSTSPLKGDWLFKNGNGKYLNASTDKNGGNVTVKKSDKSVWQTFSVTADSVKHSIAVTGSKSGRVVNVYTESKSAAGQNVTLWSVTKSDTQLWTFEYKSDAYIIRPADNSKVALTAYSDGSVKLAANTGAKEQLWYLEKPSTSAVKTVANAPKYEEGKDASPPNFGNDDIIVTSVNTVAASYNYIYAIKNDGNLWAWNNGKTKKILDDAVSVKGGGGYGDYAIKKDGTLWELDYSKLGEDINKFPSARKVMSGVTDIGVYPGGMDSSGCMGILKNDGSLWVSVYDWSSGKQTEPIQIAKKGFVSVTSVGDYLLALKDDKSLWIWEGNYVFNPNDNNTKTICFMKIIDNVKQIGKQNVYTALVIKEDNCLYVWNYAEFTSNERKKIPKEIKVLDKAASIYDWTNLATDTKGVLWTWEFDWDEDMKITFLGCSKVLENVKNAFGSRYSGTALKNDGTLWEWNEMGTPKKQKTGLTDIEAGLFYYTYIKEDGSLWAIGYTLPGMAEYSEKLITKKIFDNIIN